MSITRARRAEAPAEVSFRTLDGETERGWLELWNRTAAVPWLHPTWTRLWWSSFGYGRLAIACLRRGGRFVAVAPTSVVAGELRALANGHSPAWSILAEGDDAVAQAARALLRPRLALNLFPLRSDDAAAETLARATADARWPTATRSLGTSPTIDLARGAVPALSAQRRREIRRRWRRLAEDGAVSVELRTDTGEHGAALDRCFAVEARGWKGRAGTAIARDPATARFYRGLAEWAATQGWLRIAELRLDGSTIAFDLSLETRDVHYLLKTSFDPEHRRSGPGKLLRDAMITRAWSIRLRRYEFLGKLDEWKREWTESGDGVLQLRAFPPTVGGAARRAVFAGAWAMRDRLTR